LQGGGPAQTLQGSKFIKKRTTLQSIGRVGISPGGNKKKVIDALNRRNGGGSEKRKNDLKGGAKLEKKGAQKLQDKTSFNSAGKEKNHAGRHEVGFLANKEKG